MCQDKPSPNRDQIGSIGQYHSYLDHNGTFSLSSSSNIYSSNIKYIFILRYTSLKKIKTKAAQSFLLSLSSYVLSLNKKNHVHCTIYLWFMIHQNYSNKNCSKVRAYELNLLLKNKKEFIIIQYVVAHLHCPRPSP